MFPSSDAISLYILTIHCIRYMLFARAMISTITSPPPSAPPYRLANLANLTLGQTRFPIWSYPSAKMPTEIPSELNGSCYTFPHALHPSPGVYSVRQLVASATPLLHSVITRLGEDPPTEPLASSVLVDGLAASLSTSGRESTLPLAPSSRDAARGEIIYQANRIAKTIIQYVHESTKPAALAHDIRLRSPCEGHLWTPAVASLLLGPRSDARLMELYNEWLHRMILLRDSLLPFENYEEVALVIPEHSTDGIRSVEEPRKLFLVHCLTGAVQHTAIVDLAKVFTAPKLPQGGYGFQYAQGLVLPAFLSGSRTLHLLRYHPAKFYTGEGDVLFDYEHREYISAPRTELSASEAVASAGNWNLASLLTVEPRVTESELTLDDENNGDELRRVVKLRLTLDSGKCVSVDLGQIARGRRYAYEVRAEGELRNTSPKDIPSTQGLPAAVVHSTTEILCRPGLVISPRTKIGRTKRIHVIPTTDPLLKLALLGKLYPENVILLKEKDSVKALSKTGKGFAEQLVILERESGKISV